MFRVLRTSAIILLLSLIGLEIILRLAYPEIINYSGEVSRAIVEPERMFTANIDLSYDIAGLYEGADQVRLRVSDDRFIEPMGDPDADFQVLFLGGSTTEALYVPEDQRWVALLNSSDIATYNAGVSGANTLDKYYSFEYLTEHGWSFDLVVVMTMVNDLGWLFQLDSVDYEFRPDQYRQGLIEWHINEYEAQRTALDQLKELSRIVRVVATLSENAQTRPNTLDRILAEAGRAADYDGERTALQQCQTLEGIPTDEVLTRYQENARVNLQLLADSVHQSGANLLVMSEATSYAAPTDSFLVDLRLFYTECADKSWLSVEGFDELFDTLTQSYLEAGCQAEAFVYDLRSAMSPYSDGDEGGSYLYDEVHYTPKGSEQVAELLRPVIQTILTDPEAYTNPCDSIVAGF